MIGGTKKIANRKESSKTNKNYRHLALPLLPIFLVLLFAQLITGCSTHPDGSTQVARASQARLVDMGNGICRDTNTGKMWQIGRSKIIKSMEEAKIYTAELKEGGYRDWRLPKISELYDLYIIYDLHENGNCDLQAEGTYWSDEPDLENRVGTWELDDNCDPERQYIPKKKGHVRAIRP